jgi:hypothetical protein
MRENLGFFIVLIALLLCGPFALAQETSSGSSSGVGIFLEALYGTASIKSDELNDAREHFRYNSTTYADGTFNKMSLMGFSLGYKIYDWFAILARYEQSSQKLPETNITGGPPAPYTVAESFLYDSAYILLDFPFEFGAGFFVSARMGLGYALKYEFHQKLAGSNWSEDLVWRANPIGYKIGATFGYAFTSYFALFTEAMMESIHSELKTTKAYPNLNINNVPIESNQTYDNLHGKRRAVDVSMSGLRTSVGLRLTF